MSDDTRKLLKVSGVTVTDAEAEAERLAEAMAALEKGLEKWFEDQGLDLE
jgi:hypothetical protein